MPALDEDRIADLLRPYLADAAVPDDLYAKLGVYLDLLLKWNARTNLTAIREPEQMVTRHFGESLFLGRRLPTCETMLDFGSGAGFPGIPAQLLRPAMRVTLAESQGKKAGFLREALRVLELKTEVWPGRVKDMPAERRFNVVTARAVDRMEEAVAEARGRVRAGGTLALLVGHDPTGVPVPGGLRRSLVMIEC